MKRPTVQHLMSDMQKEMPKKRKIQPVFLGCIGSGLEQQQPGSSSFTSNVLTSSTKEQQQSETMMRANPSLIDRVGNEEGGTNKELDQNEDSMNCSTSFLNSSVENNEKNQDDKLRRLPEIISESSCELKPFPQVVNLQNIADVGLPAPQIRRNLSISISMGPKCGVDQILAKNGLKRGIKYSKMQAKFGRELKWERTIGSPLILMQANCDWICCTHEDNNLIVYSTTTGKISFSIHTNSTIAILEIRNNLCLALSIEEELTIWDLKKSIRLLQTSIKTLLLGCTSGSLQIIRATISTNGVPILVLNNGDAFLFSRSLHSWLSLNGDFLLSHIASFQLISHSLPNGLISMFIELLNCGKLVPLSANTQIDDQQMELSNGDAQMEILLRAATELNAPEEFRLLAAIYLQKLIKNGKLEKMREFIEEIKQCQNIPIHPEIILADVKPILKQNEHKFDEIMKRRVEFESSLSLLESN